MNWTINRRRSGSMNVSIRLALLAAVAWTSVSRAASNPGVKPNIIIVLADDMGFSDISCYGSEIPTPNIDALGADGLKYTQFYNTGRCCPSRAALLTGLYSHQAGVGGMSANQVSPGYLGHLNDSCVTIAEVLKSAGYFTAMTGKWHLGQDQGVTPWGRGFERNLTGPSGEFYQPKDPRTKLFMNGQAIARDDPRLPKDWYSTDLWTTFGLKFIDEARAEKKPFFLYLAHNAPHCPLQAPAEDIAKFRGKYKEGWDAIAAARFARQQKLGIIAEGWDKAPTPQAVGGWEQQPENEKDRFDYLMATYAACVYHMDKAIGDLVHGLKERGVYENTVILFMSDNGGSAETGPKGQTRGDDPTDPRSYWRCGESWAFVENTPFRLYKHFNHEGGVATPLIVHWPAGIAAKGEWRTQPSHLIDLMPTCVALSGATYPKEFNGKAITPMEGRSLVPTFANQPLQRDGLFWEHMGNAAARIGDMKLVRQGQRSPWELYDMKKDRTELHNLVSEMPDVAKKLTDQWNAWSVHAQVVPGPVRGNRKKENESE